MKKSSLALIVGSFITLFFFSLSSCTKINEGTELGGDLIPEVDNIRTFDTTLEVLTDNQLFTDNSTLGYYDEVALGNLNDPEFGQTTASFFFGITLPRVGDNPLSLTPDRSGPLFKAPRNSIVIDSVILSLAYSGAYGDTNTMQNVQVYAINPDAGFSDTGLYKINQPEFETGELLGSRSVLINTLNDSVTIIRGSDTTRLGSVLRIPLSTSLGQRFAAFDTSNTSTGGLNNDSTLKLIFPGFAVRATSGSALTYFDLSSARTNMTIYYRATINGAVDTTAAVFVHGVRETYASGKLGSTTGGQSNTILRTNGGQYQEYLANDNPQDDKLFIQSTPGSYATLTIPGISNLGNHVINRAELIAVRLPSAMETTFGPPAGLFIDRWDDDKDSAYLLENDITFTQGNVDLRTFGGILKADNTYRFNITRYVQGIVTRSQANQVLRLSAPYEAFYRIAGLNDLVPISTTPRYAQGRVVLGGGNHPDPSKRLRLRIIYSKI